MAHDKSGSASPRIQPGDRVRVKYGVADPDFPDISLGGWAGTDTEVVKREGQINCVFWLDDRTLACSHSICRRRCGRDGLEFETTGLGEEDLEIDDGIPVAIEQPTQSNDFDDDDG